MKLLRFAGMLLLACVTCTAVAAKTPEEIVRDAIGAGGLESGIKTFDALKTVEAAGSAGLGVLRFSRGIERFAQAMYRHGLRPGGRSAAPVLLGLELPRGNPNPQPLSYAQFRIILSDLSADMRGADEALAKVGETDLKLPIDLHTLRIDIDGDGKAAPGEELFNLVRHGVGDPSNATEPFVVAFDTADVQWLRGYSNLIGALVDFWLAYDFETTFNATFQAFFPANAPTNDAKILAEGQGSYGGTDGRDFADLIAMVHLINWQVVEPARLESARKRMLDVIALNRLTWKLARAEKDDDREWLPNPRQKGGVMPFFSVTDERIDAWLAAIGEIEEVLEGRRLMPHWRFSPPDLSLGFVEPKPGEEPKPLMGVGVNLKRFFAEPRPFDLVLWVTGHAALPYLEKGEISRFSAWSQAERIFEGNLFTYAFWFN
jgi:hypothetical protein